METRWQYEFQTFYLQHAMETQFAKWRRPAGKCEKVCVGQTGSEI